MAEFKMAANIHYSVFNRCVKFENSGTFYFNCLLSVTSVILYTVKYHYMVTVRKSADSRLADSIRLYRLMKKVLT